MDNKASLDCLYSCDDAINPITNISDSFPTLFTDLRHNALVPNYQHFKSDTGKDANGKPCQQKNIHAIFYMNSSDNVDFLIQPMVHKPRIRCKWLLPEKEASSIVDTIAEWVLLG